MHKILFTFAFAVPSLFSYDFSVLKEGQFCTYRDDLAEIRLTVFKEYPYLYDGDMELERGYIEHYCNTENSVLVVAKEGSRVIGTLTGIALDAVPDHAEVFRRENIPTDSIYYLGEITLLEEYRGRGIGAEMYKLFEQYVRESTPYAEIAFCEIVIPYGERRSDHFWLDEFWLKRGYLKYPDLLTKCSWKDVGSVEATPHEMVFWSKKLR